MGLYQENHGWIPLVEFIAGIKSIISLAYNGNSSGNISNNMIYSRVWNGSCQPWILMLTPRLHS
jgi:hypothetical protein